jgi:hypothetical protein
MAVKFTQIFFRREIRLLAKPIGLAVEGKKTRLRHPDSSLKKKNSLLF